MKNKQYKIDVNTRRFVSHTLLTRNCYRCHAPIASGLSHCDTCWQELEWDEKNEID